MARQVIQRDCQEMATMEQTGKVAMTDSNDKLQAGFLRARRFLIGAGLALAFANLLGIQFKKISLLGNDAEIPHPEQVGWILWAAWLWAFTQYLVWFKDVGALNELREAVTTHCSERLGALVLKKDRPDWVESDLAQDLTHQNGQKAPAEFKFCSVFTEVDLDTENRSRVANIETYAYCTSATGRGRLISQTVRWETEISERLWRKFYWRAWAKVILTSRFLLEYFAPIAIGLSPVVAALLSHHAHPVVPCAINASDCLRI